MGVVLANQVGRGRCRDNAAQANDDAGDPIGGGHRENGLDRRVVVISAITSEHEGGAREARVRVEHRLDEILQVIRLLEALHFFPEPGGTRALIVKRLGGDRTDGCGHVRIPVKRVGDWDTENARDARHVNRLHRRQRRGHSGFMDLANPKTLLRLGRPESFSGLMNLVDENYQRFQRLAPDYPLPFDTAVSRSESDFDLYLTVLERCRYTTTVHLTYRFSASENTWRADPDVTLRLYHDAGVAEVVDSCRSRCDFLQDIDPQVGGWLQRQHARNLMVYKWLGYLLQHGHGFAMAARPRT